MKTTVPENEALKQTAFLNKIAAVILIAAMGCLLLYILFGMMAMWFWEMASIVFSLAFVSALLFALLSLCKKRTARGIMLAVLSALLFILSFVPFADSVLADSRKETLEIYCTHKRLEGEYIYVIDSVSIPQRDSLTWLVGQEMDIIFRTAKLYRSFARDTARHPECIHFVFKGNLKPTHRCMLEVTDYRLNRQAYEPPYYDTVKFISYIYNGSEYPTLYGRSPDGGQHLLTVGRGYRELFKGDIVRLAMEMQCYVAQPDDGSDGGEVSYGARIMVGDIEVIEPGKLRLFTENNKKIIDYRDDSKLVETWDTRRLDGIDYYIAVGNDRQVEKYLRRPGKLWVYFHDFDKTGQRNIRRSSKCFLAEMYNEHDGKLEDVCEIVMEMTADYETLYFRYDEKNGELTPLNIE